MDAYLNLSVSPDGRKIAAQHSENSDVLATWLLDTRSGATRRFAIADAFPAWSRDGRRVAMMTLRNGVFGIIVKEASGEEKGNLLLPSGDSKIPLDWSPDNRMILFQQRSPDTNEDLMLVPADGSGPSVPLIRTARNEVDGKISPNGSWVAYVSDEVGRREVYVQPFRTGTRGAQWRQISFSGGGKPMWSRSGDELFFISADHQLMAVRVLATSDKFETCRRRSLRLGWTPANWANSINRRRTGRDSGFFSQPRGTRHPSRWYCTGRRNRIEDQEPPIAFNRKRSSWSA